MRQQAVGYDRGLHHHRASRLVLAPLFRVREGTKEGIVGEMEEIVDEKKKVVEEKEKVVDEKGKAVDEGEGIVYEREGIVNEMERRFSERAVETVAKRVAELGEKT